MAEDEELAKLGTASTVPKIEVQEIGFNALSVMSGQVLEEPDPNLRWPYCITTYKKMLNDDIIASSTELFNALLSKVPWRVDIPAGYEKELAPQAAYLRTVMYDMEHSWLSFIKQASSYIYFGFAPFEIVLDYRLKENGSKYNDGYTRVKKLALRKQDSILGWEYKNKGRDLSGLWQAVNKPQGKWNYKRGISVKDTSVKSDNGVNEQFIPRKKFLLFRNNPVNDNPEGTSPLKSVYRLWRYRTAYEETEAKGSHSDVHGLKVLYIPPEYMMPDATDENKAVYEIYKKIMRNIHIGEESGLILPMFRDELKGDKLFEFDIVNSTGQKAYDIGAIINRINKQIRTALYSDYLTIGQDGGGSYASSENKQSFVQTIIESKLEEIRDVLNHHLVPLLWEYNEWDAEIYPTFEFGEIEETSLAEFAKAFQQMSATKGIPKTVETINEGLERLGYKYRVPANTTQEDLWKMLDGGENKVGKGMETGLGSGTGEADGSSGDGTAGNSSNK